jgi:excisionase family DNA binding protein/YgiT-type zinc finger domain-containing protein
MELSTSSATFRFQGKEIELKGLETYICPNCGERIYTAQEAQMIEKLMIALNKIEVPKIDVLNLEETARYLRVSNQTVYNMIRDGRIKAYKVGREWRFLRTDILTYMNESSNQDYLAMAAKGGTISSNDLAAIKTALEEEDD